MIEKITFERFQQIRNQLSELIKQYEESDDANKHNADYDMESAYQRFLDQYISVQSELLSYDLSDIPFEAWDGYEIVVDEIHPADFSKTKANIDFNLVDYIGNGNFRGCNIRNLEKLSQLNPQDFDDKTISENASLFLTDIFSNEFKSKYYSRSLSIEDLVGLSAQQLEELNQKNYIPHININSRVAFKSFGLYKAVQLYNNSHEEFDEVVNILNAIQSVGAFKKSELPSFEEFLEQIKDTDVSELKKACFEYARKQITNSSVIINQNSYPESFINANSDIFLVDANIPEEVKQRYFSRKLKLRDLLDYPDAFSKIPVDYFMTEATHISQLIRDNYGMGKFQELLQKHPDVFEHIVVEDDLYGFTNFLKIEGDLERSFTIAVKEYFAKHISDNFNGNDGQYNVPGWISSMNFHFVEKLKTKDDLLQFDDSVFIIDDLQRLTIDIMNIENIKKLEEEIGFFSHKSYEWSKDLEMLHAFGLFFRKRSQTYLSKLGLNFKNGSLSYQEFLNVFAKCLNAMRKDNMFLDYPNYDWIQGDFRINHPEIFIYSGVPDELRAAFYKNKISPELLFQHKEYISYLVDKDLSDSLKINITLNMPGLTSEHGNIIPNCVNFIDEFVSRYGSEKFLRLVSKYGTVLSNITVNSLHGEIDDEQAIERSLRKSIYNEIIKGKIDYSYLSDIPEMLEEYPEIFANFDGLTSIPQKERKKITTAFYSGTFSFDYIKKYPELMTILKDKNLFLAFSSKDGVHHNGRIFRKLNQYSDLELLQIFGNENFLELCAKYGRYLDGIATFLSKDITIRFGKYIDLGMQHLDGLSFKFVSKLIEETIVRESLLGNISYQPEDAPDFLKERHPELFLENDAPPYLQEFFYNRTYPLTFKMLQKHKEWLPFLKDKSISASLLRNRNSKDEMIRFLEVFGDRAIKLGISRADTVTEMINSHQVDLMKKWYDKTGGKFIPDFVVMQNFRLEDSDKFLSSGANWSSLMRIESFAREAESRDAMLKLAYSFGAFDQDQRGFKKLLDLLTGLPRTIDSQHGYIINRLERIINEAIPTTIADHAYEGELNRNIIMTAEGRKETFDKIIDHVKENFKGGVFYSAKELIPLLEALKEENVDIDFSKPFFSQLYRENDDGTYSLVVNTQSCPKTTQTLRYTLLRYKELPILTPDKAHKLFGGFELKYDAEFREFLLANLDRIMENPEYSSLVASIQKNFSNIRSMNSNRVLTMELAISFVQSNKYDFINVGNERVAEISAIAGYSQADFDILQQIYNYGKMRTFSSIPRIEKSVEKASGRYTYEILRLDDPLAMAIGTLTDCCQELNDSAEACMEHSMVDKNGRVFIIKDENGNIVSQSWVWRNKDVLCFDNVEIPDKAFARSSKEHPDLGRKGFTDDVFEIYRQAAHDLIEEDEIVYRQLLESGKITQEQYDGLRLGKITVGLGYNDIAKSLKQKSKLDIGDVARPLAFKEPVKLSKGLYTKDSLTQYILEERDDRKEYDGGTLAVHSDTYVEHTDSTFTEKALFSLEKLEIVTKENPKDLEIATTDYTDSKHIVSEIAGNYGLNPETTRIILHPNFAIIYDVNGNKLKVGDLLFNTYVDNEQQQMNIENQVVMQMNLAFEQIAGDKEVDISALNDKQKAMYSKVINLTNEMDIERGVGHAK